MISVHKDSRETKFLLNLIRFFDLKVEVKEYASLKALEKKEVKDFAVLGKFPFFQTKDDCCLNDFFVIIKYLCNEADSDF